MTRPDASSPPSEFGFAKLTGHSPFRWQRRLFEDWFARGRLPSACDIPTGLGKTSVIAIWYLAVKAGAAVPRRLVYVVDRRAVVDQATSEAVKIKKADPKLRVSTLRGQHVDNREWLADPAAPAIIVGTVDMIGSRLLFSGYGVSRKMRPYHAGLLGADTLVVLDEAHLVPPFEELLKTIANGVGTPGPRAQQEQDREIVPPLRLLSLSATGWTGNEERQNVFCLMPEDRNDESVMERLEALKLLTIIELAKPQELVQELADRAWRLGEEGQPARVLIYCDRREDAEKVRDRINKKFRKDQDCSQLLVGGRRVYEREKLSDWLKEKGFIGGITDAPTHPTFLIATSAGEVGVDLDADHMVCDLVTWERMVQRLGRVNRRGKGKAKIEVIAATAQETDQEWKDRLARLRKPLDSLCPANRENVEPDSQLGGRDASPGAILELRARAAQDQGLKKAIEAATTPAPLRPALTRALVDAWSLTSLAEHTGRPDDIQPWLRGWEENQQPQTTVVWRKHMPVREGASKKEISAFFEAAPPHVSEKLETETDRVVKWLKGLGSRAQDDGVVVAYVLSYARECRHTLYGRNLGGGKEENNILNDILVGNILVMDARFGGLADGMLCQSPEPPRTIDDGGDWLLDEGKPIIRFRVQSVVGDNNAEPGWGWRERLRFDLERTPEGEAARWLLVEKWRDDSETEDDRSIGRLQELAEHHAWTEAKARALANALGLPDDYVELLAIAARLHDEGKRHPPWQQAAKVPRDGRIYAKTDKRMNIHLLDNYRHEFGSLPFAEGDKGFMALPANLRELVLHLIAAHHGWARPVISITGGADPPSVLEVRARDVALRFARLQKRWGPWGLAWWEALLRAADQQASRDNDARETV